MSWSPSAKIYQDDGVTLLYTIEHIMVPITGWPNKTNPSSVALANLRSQGEIIIPGGNNASDIIIRGRLTAGNYTNMITAWNALTTAIPANTPLYLKIDTSISSTDDLKVQRLVKPEIIKSNNMVSWLYYALKFRYLTW